ncbi:HugZ family protein [Hahella ganghwensis]|uniref:HugZ family pyridoxamine 5'-phosphate oxidase n=1 Tax=Hahella ganghwensis TaxID=286420 RepID=UPI00036A0729|nr:pyridoxamine 5'-phosphate oxidase family protein [Hahella ganghwensis]
MPENPHQPGNPEIREEILTLIDRLKSLQMATLNATGQPEASYTPFVYQSSCFYIFVSALAPHTRNLIERKQCGIMLIEDEAQARNLFARTRLMIDAGVESVPADAEEYAEILEVMENRLGNTVGILRSLPDFSLLRLVFRSGRFVKGFGAAYSINDPEFRDIVQVTGK